MERSKEVVTYELGMRDLEGGRKAALRLTTKARKVRVTIDLPANYRVTLGPLVPGAKSADPDRNPLTFRAYEGSKCRLVLRDVEWFRDTSLKVTTEKGEDFFAREIEEDHELKPF